MESSYPSGAEELAILIQTPTKHGIGLPALLHGRPGSGKTSFVENLRFAPSHTKPESLKIVTLVASILDASDVAGLPYFEQGKTRFAAPEWSYVFDDVEHGILFLDELTCAPHSVQAALLRVILNRCVGSKQLSPNVRIIAAANAADEIEGGFQLSAPLCNRFCHLSWEMSVDAFAKGMRIGFEQPTLPIIDYDEHHIAKQRWQDLIAAFVLRNRAMLNTSPAESELAFASARTWDMASALLASCELLGLAPTIGDTGSPAPNSLVTSRLLVGTIGSVATTAFLGFLRNLDLPDPAMFLSGKVQVDPSKLRDDSLYVFFSSLAVLIDLRSAKSKTEDRRLISDSLRMLKLVLEICRCGKLDCVFAQVKGLLESNWLQQVIMSAHRVEDSQLKSKLDKAMRALEDTDLATYMATITSSLTAAR